MTNKTSDTIGLILLNLIVFFLVVWCLKLVQDSIMIRIQTDKPRPVAVETVQSPTTKEVLKPTKLVDNLCIEWDDSPRRIAGRTVVFGLQDDGVVVWRAVQK